MKYWHFRDLLGPSRSILREILVVFWTFSIFEVSEWSSWSLGVPGGSFWGPGRSGEVSGEVWGSQGGSRGVAGGLPKMTSFSFCWRWICSWSNEIWPCSKWGHFVKRSVVIVSCYVFVVFRSLYCCETVRWICYKKQLFFNNSENSIFGFGWILMKI